LDSYEHEQHIGRGKRQLHVHWTGFLNTINPTQGQYYATIRQIDPGGTASYQGLLLSGQRRLANGISALANWTWSHCISDPPTTELTGPTYINPLDRSADRSNCASDRRRLVNISVVATSKLSNKTLNRIFGNWQLSPIAQWQTGNYATISTGVDDNLTGVGTQRPFQLLPDVYMPNRAYTQYLNPKAFGIPGPGQISPMRPLNVLNPGLVEIDVSLARWFAITERRKIQVRAEAFNVPNISNAPAPVTALNATNFGQMVAPAVGGHTVSGLNTVGPRIMQFALKYVF